MIKKILSALKVNAFPGTRKKGSVSADGSDHPSTLEPTEMPIDISRPTGGWEIKHTVSGRIRFRNKGLYRNMAFSQTVENKLMHTPGILSCTVSRISCSVVIHYDEIRMDTVRILSILNSTREAPETARPKDGDHADLAISTSSLAVAAIGQFAIPPLIPVGAVLLLYACLPDFKKGLRTILEKRRLSTQLLSPIVLSSCILAGEILAGAFMVWSFSLGRKLLQKTYDNSQRLLIGSFGNGNRSFKVIRDGMKMEIPHHKIAYRDVLLLQTGDMIPADGIIQQGFGLIDQSPLTGDSQPTEKGVGDRVYHTSILLFGPMTIMVEKVGPNTLAGRIDKSLHTAMDAELKGHDRGESFADKAVAPTLALGTIAAMTGGISGGIAIANCDFGIGPRVSAPLCGLAALSRCMENGIVVKDIRKLENLSEVDTILFDRNSLLDHQRPAVHRIITCGDYHENRILRICAAALHRFSHPIAGAIQKKCHSLNLEIPPAKRVQYHVEEGITAEVLDHVVYMGGTEFMKKQGISVPESMSGEMARRYQQGYLPVMVGCDQNLMGAVELCAFPHGDMHRVLTGLRRRGIKQFAILSGDTRKATAALAETLGIERYFSDVPPQAAPRYINLLKKEGRTVCFLASGNRVAAAVPDAHSFISLDGLAGIDKNAAPLLFLKEDLTHLPVLFDISHDMERKMKRSRHYTLLSNSLCIAGVFFLGFGVWHSVIFTSAAMLAALMSNLRSIQKIADNKVDKVLEMEMFLAVQETGLITPLLTKASRSATQAALSSVNS